MRGRWASMAIGAGIARHRAGAAADQERQAYESQQDQAQRQIEAQQRQIESLQGQGQTQQKPRQEDLTKKLEKYGDLRQKGLLTERSFKNSRRTYYPKCSLQSYYVIYLLHFLSFCILSIVPVAVLSDTEHFALAIDAILADAFIPTVSTTRIIIVGFAIKACLFLRGIPMHQASSYFGRLLPPMLLIRFRTGLGFTAINIAALTGSRRGEECLASGLIDTSRQIEGPHCLQGYELFFCGYTQTRKRSSTSLGISRPANNERNL